METEFAVGVLVLVFVVTLGVSSRTTTRMILKTTSVNRHQMVLCPHCNLAFEAPLLLTAGIANKQKAEKSYPKYQFHHPEADSLS